METQSDNAVSGRDVTDQLTEIQVSLEGVRKDISHLVKTLDDNIIPRINSHAIDIKSLNTTRSRTRGGAAAVLALGAGAMLITKLFGAWR